MRLSDEDIEWIRIHSNENIDRLRFKYHGNEKFEWLVTQIDCRKRCNSKLPFLVDIPSFIFPSTIAAEQCTSESLAKFHSTLIDNGDSVLDMTCGLGIDTIYLASKASEVTSLEIDTFKAQVAKLNMATLGLDNVEIIEGDSCDFIYKSGTSYDTIFIDPARRDSSGKRVFGLTDCTPDVCALMPEIKQKCRKLVIKASPMLDIAKTLNDLGENVSEFYILGTPTECKEIVVVVDFSSAISKEPQIIPVTIDRNGTQCHAKFSFTLDEEKNADSQYSADIKAGAYLYEPYPALMKSGAVKLIGKRFGVDKLHKNTHLYVSDTLVGDFPGTIFKIVEVLGAGKSEREYIKEKYPIINVSARNFGMTPDELRKKLKVKDGGDFRLVGLTTADEKKSLVVASPLKSASY